MLRLWWYLSPGLYTLALLDQITFVQNNPWVKTIAAANPFAILFDAYRTVIYGTAPTETTPGSLPGFPDWSSLAILLVASVLLLAVTTVVFKRLEPNFAKVL